MPSSSIAYVRGLSESVFAWRERRLLAGTKLLAPGGAGPVQGSAERDTVRPLDA